MKKSTKSIKVLQTLISNLLHKDMICTIDHYPYSYLIVLISNLLVKLIICNCELTDYSKKQIIDIKNIIGDYCDALDLFNNEPKQYTKLQIDQATYEILQGLNADKR